ncbi:hypothetical protein FOMPIDRAFT_102059 [Fomitopsis schrenkii]|uniref:BCS1 N-terminal domain-containing protein n=1 Tax=Fomitopsis schrenkii TaxID=2126942 RepID=S8EUE0_FOMSC|nr:hypothetical protein FOMPIDRAFT_102059 [Fomitopsis schrenkii]
MVPALTLSNATLPFAAADFHAFVSTVLSFTATQDWLKLFVVGSLLEMLRRYLSSFWTAIMRTFWITANFDSHTEVYQWVFFWLSRQPVWKNARDVDVSTITYDTTYTLWYKGRYVVVTRIEKAEYRWQSREFLQLRILSSNQSLLRGLVNEAREAYKAAEKDVVSIYTPDSCSAAYWTLMTSRPKRPLDSIILDPGVKEMLVRDARDFLGSWTWYAERGIPFRRGYLLYGAPGSGKTSMIQSIAGEG